MSSNCDYRNPEEFHQLRYSLAHNQGKPRRPSSAKRKDDNPLKNNQKEFKSAHEIKASHQLKSYQLDKNSFLDQVACKETASRPSRNEEYRYNSNYELKKNKIYESKRNSHRESRKRSSSKDRVAESPKTKNSRTRQDKNLNRSRSKNSGKYSNRSNDKHSDKYLQKAKSSSQLGHPLKSSHQNSTSLKFNNILKDMGAHCGGHSTNFFNYTEKIQSKEMNVSNVSKPQTEHDKCSSRYSSNLEASIKLKDAGLKPNDIFMMNTNNNHHYNYLYNNSQNVNSRDQKKSTMTHTQTKENSSNACYKVRQPVIGSSSGYHENPKKAKKSSRKTSGMRHIEDPAIPFPQSQKHQSSKLSPSNIDFASSG